jgi:hypothetical protein
MAAQRVSLWRVVADIVHHPREHALIMMAAALAFYRLLGFIPLLLVGASAVGDLLGSSDRAADEVMALTLSLVPRTESNIQAASAILRNGGPSPRHQRRWHSIIRPFAVISYTGLHRVPIADADALSP